MAYDPQGAQTPEQQLGFGDIAREVVNPANLLIPYAMDPRSYSKKGFWSPFSLKGSAWKKEFKNIYSHTPAGWTAKGEYVSAVTKFQPKNVFGAMGRLGPFGGNKIQGTSRIHAIRRQARLKSLISGYDTQLGNLHSEKMNSINNKISGVNKLFSASRFYEKQSIAEMDVLDKKIANIGNLKNVAIKKFKPLKTKISLLKWGSRGAKVASAAGLAMFAWDIGKAVATPLAQAAMGAINNVAMEYQNRFMPEMGGQLQLSYLSQASATERQRAVQAISKSYINGRSAFGSEGSMMHS